MPRSLSGKMILAMAALLALTSVVYVGLTVVANRHYVREISQSLNRSLAANIVKSERLIRGKRVESEALEQVFEMLMKINPAIEVYLLDPAGRILAFSAAPGKVKRQAVSLAPVSAFLSGTESLPIRGDDPRDPGRRKIFSAAPIVDRGSLQGYLYVVLGGEAYDTAAGMFERSYILRLTLAAVAASLLLIGISGALSFDRLTRRLRRLAALMEALRRSDFRRRIDVSQERFRAPGDEIDRLGRILDEMARRIVDQIAELESADGARRELFANVSHDLRTPLAALKSAIETLLIKGDALPETEQRHYLRLALGHADRLGRLIGQLFELATLENGDRGLHAEIFSIAELVQDVAQKYRPEAEKRSLVLVCEVPPDAPAVAADIGLIERVVENLTENALKYTPANGTVRLSVAIARDSISTSVADTGRGIAAVDLPRIFDRAYRSGIGEDKSGGVGLGLAIAQQILHLHGSALEVESVVGRGTTFRFELPAEIGGRKPSRRPPAGPETQSAAATAEQSAA